MASAHSGTEPTPARVDKSSRERRTARRFELALPLVLLPLADLKLLDKRPDLPTGRTRDISTKGVYFTTDVPLAPGSDFAFTAMLSSDLTNGRRVYVCGQAKVVRTDKQKSNGTGHMGVAAVIKRFEIVKEDPLYAEFFGAKPEAALAATSAPH